MNTINPYIIKFPPVLNTKNAINFSNLIYNIQKRFDHKTYIIDFSNVEKAFPFGILFSANILKHFIKKAHSRRREVRFNYSSSPKKITSYLKHIGFFQYLGEDAGRMPGEAYGSENYIPITVFSKSTLLDEATKQGKHIGEIIVKKSHAISNIIDSIYSEADEDNVNFLKDAIAYSSREIMRNSIEHSQSEEVVILVQSFPTLKKIDIAIMDTGIGIYSTLSKKYILHSKIEAIEKALLPGISCTNTNIKTDDAWQNSGFGLYIVSELCKKLNDFQFYIASSDASYSITKNKIIDRNHHVWAPGTTILISIGVDNDCYFSNILEQIVQEGERIAQIDNPNAKASKMSKIV